MKFTKHLKPLSIKRILEIEKSKEEFEDRLKASRWQHEPSLDCFFRLSALIQFDSKRSTRQIFNAAENIYKRI